MTKKHYKYYTADVFTNTPFNGVPLPVFPQAQGMTDEQMQRLASELCTSSTVFLFPSEKEHTRKIRVFTPQKEIPSSVHTILAASYILAAIEEVKLEYRHTVITLIDGINEIESFVSQEKGIPTIVSQTYDTHAAIDY